MFDSAITISLELLSLVAGVDEFKGRWEALGQLVPSRLQALQRIAAIEAVAAAARMKGTLCSDRQIGEFISGSSPGPFSRQEQELINGYYLVRKLINESYGQISFIGSHVRQMHELLMNRGEFVSGEDQDPGLPKKLTDLIEQTRELLAEGRVHPLLVVADFSCRFRHLRPFRHGNVFMTWLLIQLLMLRGGYLFTGFGSIERFLEKSVSSYQEKVFVVEDGEVVTSANPESWLVMFLEAMLAMSENIVAKINREKQFLKLSPALLAIVRMVQENGQANIAQIIAATGMNRNTLKVRLRKLVAEKHLVQRGRGKATFYLLPELHLQ